jgi:hypothetical protein
MREATPAWPSGIIRSRQGHTPRPTRKFSFAGITNKQRANPDPFMLSKIEPRVSRGRSSIPRNASHPENPDQLGTIATPQAFIRYAGFQRHARKRASLSSWLYAK